MKSSGKIDRLLVERIHDGDTDAWNDLIGRYEGRLLAFAESRLRRRAPSEDVVQETFIGFLHSLPNYDFKRPLEAYLFSICAHKLTDHLRREGRRPTLPLPTGSGETDGSWDLAGKLRPASSIARSGERRHIEEEALVQAISEQVGRWQERGDWAKLMCIEALFVRGWANQEVANMLGITEQQVANFKFDFLAGLKTAVKKQALPQDVFPELYE
jgi:RNA polymerase sigma-70 factor (ECF subfamily)